MNTGDSVERAAALVAWFYRDDALYAEMDSRRIRMSETEKTLRQMLDQEQDVKRRWAREQASTTHVMGTDMGPQQGNACDTAPSGPPPGYPIPNLETIDEAMAYHPWDHNQREAGEVVREALTAAAKAILRHVPPSRYRTAALDLVLDARMKANAAITFRGRF